MRVTMVQLENQASSLNSLLGRPLESWTRVPGTMVSTHRANVGNLYIENFLGSTRLVEMTNATGAIRNVVYADAPADLHGKLEAMLLALQMQGAKPPTEASAKMEAALLLEYEHGRMAGSLWAIQSIGEVVAMWAKPHPTKVSIESILTEGRK